MMNYAKTCLAMAAALCIVEGVEASPLGWLVKSMFRQNEKAEHERQNREFESMMRDWTDFARTNLSVETTASFRDKVLVPFVRKEMPNPFSPGGKMSNEPWAAEANEVYEAGLRFICDDEEFVAEPDERLGTRADKLVSMGCEDPFILMLSAFNENFYWLAESTESGPRLAKAKEIADKTPNSEFLQMLLCYYRRLARAELKGDDIKVYLDKWVTRRDFTGDDEIPFFGICYGFSMTYGAKWLDGEKYGWSRRVFRARKIFSDANVAAGLGVVSKMDKKARRKMPGKIEKTRQLLNEAEGLRPGRFETLSAWFRIVCESRYARREQMDQLFVELSKLRLDDWDTLGYNYCWHRFYPRWRQTSGYGEMLRFADACYETQRHDTILPYLYAEIQFRYVRDSNVDPYEYFRNNPEIADKCIDVCMRQCTNEYATGAARLLAPYMGAAAAYYSGRYEDMARFDPPFSLSTRSGNWYIDRILHDPILIRGRARSFRSAFSNECISIQRMFDAGDYGNALAAIEEVNKSGKLKSSDFRTSYRWTQFAVEKTLDIRMKTDFKEGKAIDVLIPLYLYGWAGVGGYRNNDKTLTSYNAFEWSDHFTWRAPLPKENEFAFTLDPKPKSSGRRILIVSRHVHEESHEFPLNGIPFVTFIWEKDRTGVYLANDYYEMFKIDYDAAVWKEAKSGKRRIMIVSTGTRIEVFVDDYDKPLISSDEYSVYLKRSPDIGYLRLRSENIRMSDMSVRKPVPVLHTSSVSERVE